MNALTNFTMKNVAAVFIIIALLVVGGVYETSQLKMENLPDVSFPVVLITDSYIAPPADIMEQITKPIEKKIASIEGISSLSSTSSDNNSSVILFFDQNVDVEKKKTEIESLLQDVRLPTASAKPKVSTFGFTSLPSYYIAVYAENGMSQTELDKLYDASIKPGFQGLKGFDHMDAIGTRETSLAIKLDAGALTTYGLSVPQVSNALRAMLTTGPAGVVDFSGNTLMVRVKNDTTSLYSLQNAQLSTGKGGTVLLKQLGLIEAVTESNFITRLDDKPALAITLYKTKSANAVSYAAAADKLMTDWKTTLPNVTFKPIYNTAVDVKQSINGLLREGIMGVILASLTILLFLRNVRMTLIVLISIPLSILITLLLMAYLNITLNIMTLGGMFIAVGRVVDDSIVVIENIFTHLQKAQNRNESVIKLATKQVSSAITTSTLTTVGVFAPIGMVTGTVGEIFRPFAITLACALLASLLVALTVIPMLAKLLVMNSKRIVHLDEMQEGKFKRYYRSALTWSLTHRIKTLLIAGLIFIVSLVGIIPQLALAFIPDSAPSRQFYFKVQLPHETSIHSTDNRVKDIENMLKNTKDSKGNPQFTYIESLVGYSDGITSEQVPYDAEIYTEVSLGTDVDAVKKSFKAQILNDLPPGSAVDTRALGGGGGGGGISSTDFSYSLKGDDQNLLAQAAVEIEAKLKTFPELEEITDTLSDSKSEVQIDVDQNKALSYGLSPASIIDTVRSWIQKDTLGDLKFDNVSYTTTVELDNSNKDSLSQLDKIPFKTAAGTTIYLNEVAKLHLVQAPVSLQREKQQQVVKISAKINATNKNGVSHKVAAALQEIQLPDGVSNEVGGVGGNINDSFSQLGIAMVVAVAVVFLVMVFAFGNLGAPLAILFSLPLAAIGGLLGLFITHESLNVTSMIGFMMLIGIVVTNAVVYIDRTEQMRREGMPVREALIESGMTRLRPIIMTAGATIFALIPLALGLSDGTIISKGLAIVVIGGLTTSTLLTLVVVPVVYEMLGSIRRRIARLFSRKAKKSIEATG
ncbi:MAG: putative efflux system [Bacilli bacterium]|nr:putative efflux system [Bacilli bacterium]